VKLTIKLIISNQNIGASGKGKTKVPAEKPLDTEKKSNKFNSGMMVHQGIEPGPPWWEPSDLTTMPSLHLASYYFNSLGKNSKQA